MADVIQLNGTSPGPSGGCMTIEKDVHGEFLIKSHATQTKNEGCVVVTQPLRCVGRITSSVKQ